MKKTILSTLLMGSFSITPLLHAETIRIATEGAYPPFNYVDSKNNLHGFDVEITNALCAKMNAECTIVAQDWDGIIPGLIAKKYDAVVASMINTPERRIKVSFTNHYYNTPLSLAVKKGSNTTMDNFDASGLVIGAQSASTQAFYAEDVLAAKGATVKLYPTQDEANADLANGRLDAVIADMIPLMEWVNNHGDGCCEYVGDFEGTNAEAAIAVRKEDDQLKERFNQAIDAIVADGTYLEISNRYFGTNIY